MKRALVLPLTANRIEAAIELFEHDLPQWRAADAALGHLARAMPMFDYATNLIKIATVNTLYGTNLRATHRMALHLETVLDGVPPGEPVRLIEAIAAMPALAGERVRTHRSFASKFSHFFIDAERFPILDAAACDALQLHLGARGTRGARNCYATFVSTMATLQRFYGLSHSTRELDRYLWITGMYLRYAKGDREINRDLLKLFGASVRPVGLRLIVEPLDAWFRDAT